MTKREKLIVSLMRPVNPSLIVILGVYTILWGLWVINPFWTVFTQASLYSILDHLAGETFWGALAITFGSVTTYGAIKPSYFNLHLGAFAACMHWLLIGILYIMGDWQNTGGITALTFAVYAAVVWLNIKINKAFFSTRS